MKRKLIAALISLCMTVAICLTLVACVPSEQQAKSYVSLDINPSIELTLDSRDNVISIRGANEDGQVLLYGEQSLVGLKVDEAVAKITELAVDLGYLGDDNKVVQTNVVADARAEAILTNINAKVTATAEKAGLTVSCEGADAYSLLRKLDNLKAQYPDSKAIQSLTPSKLKLVVSASETGEISVEAAAEMDTSELVAMVSEAHAQMKEYATAAYSEAKTIAEDAFAKTQATVMDGIYTRYFAAKHPLETYYAFSYQGYKISSVATNALANVLFYAEQACDSPLNEEQIAAISKTLGLGDNVEQLKNSQGEITVKSIEAYADKMFKNSEANANLEQAKAELTKALNSAESAIQAEIDKFNAKYQTELEQIKKSLTESVKNIQGVLINLVPNEIKQQIDSMSEDIDDIVNEINAIISDGKITSDEVRALSDELKNKSTAAFKAMDARLTDAEREEIASMQKNAEANLANAKEQMDKAIEQAETQAKAYLEQLKEARASK